MHIRHQIISPLPQARDTILDNMCRRVGSPILGHTAGFSLHGENRALRVPSLHNTCGVPRDHLAHFTAPLELDLPGSK